MIERGSSSTCLTIHTFDAFSILQLNLESMLTCLWKHCVKFYLIYLNSYEFSMIYITFKRHSLWQKVAVEMSSPWSMLEKWKDWKNLRWLGLTLLYSLQVLGKTKSQSSKNHPPLTLCRHYLWICYKLHFLTWQTYPCPLTFIHIHCWGMLMTNVGFKDTFFLCQSFLPRPCSMCTRLLG